jgi:DNA-binding response OmpR family regulator
MRKDLPLSGRRILVVDDNAGIATLIAGLLQDAGAAVDVCRSADAAVAQAVRRVPALAVIHLPLPKDAAAALSQRLRRNAALSGIRTIILSGEEGNDIEAAESADAVHPRPISPQRLMEDVARLLLTAPSLGDDHRQ